MPRRPAPAAGPSRPRVGGRPRRPRPGRADDGVPAVQRAQQAGATGAVGVRHQQHDEVALPRGRARPRPPAGSRRRERGQQRPGPAPPAAARRSACGAASSRPARRRPQHGRGGRAGEQLPGQPLQVALADPAGGGQLVGVPGDARGGELVDVGEHQLGEAGQRLGGQPGRDRRGRSSAATRRARPPGRPPAARPSSGRCAPRPGPARRRPRGRARIGVLGVGAAAGRRQLQEAAERELDGVADGPAHRRRRTRRRSSGPRRRSRPRSRSATAGSSARIRRRSRGRAQSVPGGRLGRRSSGLPLVIRRVVDRLFAANRMYASIHVPRHRYFTPCVQDESST